MIDEFPALGKLEILQESLAFVGYGIKCCLISQDINQLKNRETGYGPDETITSNCHVQTAFPPNRLETAEHLSKLTGQTTIVKEHVTRSGRGLGSQVSTTMHEVNGPF
jgi:type IV secretion system protein VirD4